MMWINALAIMVFILDQFKQNYANNDLHAATKGPFSKG